MIKYFLLPVCLVICGCAGRMPVESVEKPKTPVVSAVLPVVEPPVFLLDVTDPVTGEVRTVGISKAGKGTFSVKGRVSCPVAFSAAGVVLRTVDKAVGTEISVSELVWANERGYVKLKLNSLQAAGETEKKIGEKKVKLPKLLKYTGSFDGPVFSNEWSLIGLADVNGEIREVRIRLRRP